MTSKPVYDSIRDGLFASAASCIKNWPTYAPYFTKAVVKYRALYWPFSVPGKYLFVSPEDKVMGIVLDTDTIPMGQPIHSADMQIVHLALADCTLEAMRLVNDGLTKQLQKLEYAEAHPVKAVIWAVWNRLVSTFVSKPVTKLKLLSAPEDVVTMNHALDYYRSFITGCVMEILKISEETTYTRGLGNGLSVEIDSSMPNVIKWIRDGEVVTFGSVVEEVLALRHLFFLLVSVLI